MSTVKYLEKDYDVKTRLLDWQKRGRLQTVSGYGVRLISNMVIRIKGEKIWRRVYVTQTTNTSSEWVKIKGEKVYLNYCVPND